jgi:hypothetical protein
MDKQSTTKVDIFLSLRSILAVENNDICPYEAIISLRGDYGTCLDIFPTFLALHTVKAT